MKKSEREEVGPPCPRCHQTNRPERSFYRKCGWFLGVSKLQRTTKRLARGAPPKHMSERRKAQADARADVVEFVHERDRTCQAVCHGLTGVQCGGPLDVHEICPRSAWAAGYLVVENCVLVCRNHHQWIDGHVRAAHALGLHRYSWERPGLHPESDTAAR